MKDLTKIKKPFGLLGEKTRAALEAHGGPYQVYCGDGWQCCTLGLRDFTMDSVVRVKPQIASRLAPFNSPATRELWSALKKNKAEFTATFGGLQFKPITEVIARPDEQAAKCSTQSEIYAAVREFQHNYPTVISDFSSKAANALAALRVPS